MDYQATVEWMFQQLPMYQNLGAVAYKNNLDNTILFANHLNNPQQSLQCIHVAGTNGKGSTSHMLASILQESGLKVGLYTSPHLKDFRERIKINNTLISEDFVVSFIANNKGFLEKNSLSFFEMSTLMAFQYFKEQKTDINVIEVGLGGRLDSTNIISPLVSIITNIGLDHTQFLGDTYELIAKEKAGIIKETIPVVIGECNDDTKRVFEEIALKKNAKIFFASDGDKKYFESDLKGIYQESNKKTVLKTVDILKTHYQFKISENDIISGLNNVIKNTGLLGRWLKINNNPLVICDTAHNKEAFVHVVQQLNTINCKNLRIVIGFVSDKSIEAILENLPKHAIYYFTQPNNLRALESQKLSQQALKYHLKGDAYVSVTSAYEKALADSSPEDFILITGSNFVVAEIL